MKLQIVRCLDNQIALTSFKSRIDKTVRFFLMSLCSIQTFNRPSWFVSFTWEVPFWLEVLQEWYGSNWNRRFPANDRSSKGEQAEATELLEECCRTRRRLDSPTWQPSSTCALKNSQLKMEGSGSYSFDYQTNLIMTDHRSLGNRVSKLALHSISSDWIGSSSSFKSCDDTNLGSFEEAA